MNVIYFHVNSLDKVYASNHLSHRFNLTKIHQSNDPHLLIFRQTVNNSCTLTNINWMFLLTILLHRIPLLPEVIAFSQIYLSSGTFNFNDMHRNKLSTGYNY